MCICTWVVRNSNETDQFSQNLGQRPWVASRIGAAVAGAAPTARELPRRVPREFVGSWRGALDRYKGTESWKPVVHLECIL